MNAISAKRGKTCLQGGCSTVYTYLNSAPLLYAISGLKGTGKRLGMHLCIAEEMSVWPKLPEGLLAIV